jgi:hypothetical protein
VPKEQIPDHDRQGLPHGVTQFCFHVDFLIANNEDDSTGTRKKGKPTLDPTRMKPSILAQRIGNLDLGCINNRNDRKKIPCSKASIKPARTNFRIKYNENLRSDHILKQRFAVINQQHG